MSRKHHAGAGKSSIQMGWEGESECTSVKAEDAVEEADNYNEPLVSPEISDYRVCLLIVDSPGSEIIADVMTAALAQYGLVNVFMKNISSSVMLPYVTQRLLVTFDGVLPLDIIVHDKVGVGHGSTSAVITDALARVSFKAGKPVVPGMVCQSSLLEAKGVLSNLADDWAANMLEALQENVEGLRVSEMDLSDALLNDVEGQGKDVDILIATLAAQSVADVSTGGVRSSGIAAGTQAKCYHDTGGSKKRVQGGKSSVDLTGAGPEAPVAHALRKKAPAVVVTVTQGDGHTSKKHIAGSGKTSVDITGAGPEGPVKNSLRKKVAPPNSAAAETNQIGTSKKRVEGSGKSSVDLTGTGPAGPVANPMRKKASPAITVVSSRPLSDTGATKKRVEGNSGKTSVDLSGSGPEAPLANPLRKKSVTGSGASSMTFASGEPEEGQTQLHTSKKMIPTNKGDDHIVLTMDEHHVDEPVLLHKKRGPGSHTAPGYESMNAREVNPHPDSVSETPKKRIPGAGGSSIVLG